MALAFWRDQYNWQVYVFDLMRYEVIMQRGAPLIPFGVISSTLEVSGFQAEM